MRKRVSLILLVLFAISALVAVAGVQEKVVRLLSSSPDGVVQATTPTTQSLIDAGKVFLTSKNIIAARNSFKQAVELDATNQEAQFLYGLTRIFAVYEDNQYVQTAGLDSIREILELSGLSFTNFGLYDTQTAPATGTGFPSTTPRSGDVINYVSTRVLPEINGAIGNFGAVTNATFVSSLDPSAVMNSYAQTVNVDYGDVQVLKAIASLMVCNLELLNVYGLDFSPPDVFGGAPELQLKRLHDLVVASPKLLTPVKPASLTTAKAGLVGFIDTFKTAATAIGKRTDKGGHAFVLDIPLNDSPIGSTTFEVNQIIKSMDEIKASLSGATYYSFTGSTVVNLSKFFNAAAPINIRQQLVTCTSTGGVLDDMTIGGLFPLGLSDLQNSLLFQKDFIKSAACSGYEKPEVSVPDRIFFSSMNPGSNTMESNITIQNSGLAPLVVSSIKVLGDSSADFTISNVSCSSTTPTLALGTSCDVKVSYNTMSGNGFSSAYIELASNAPTAKTIIPMYVMTATTTPAEKQLSITLSGTGTGTVESFYYDPNSMNFRSIICSSGTCTQPVAVQQTIRLKAMPDDFTHLTKWVGCDSVDGTDCIVNCAKDNAVTAQFDLDPRTLSVTVYPTPGSYSTHKAVSFVTNEQVTIKYTLDGTIPVDTSMNYEGPIDLPIGTTTVRYGYIGKGAATPTYGSATYTITPPTPNPPEITSFAASTTPGSFTVKITDLSVSDSAATAAYCVTSHPDPGSCSWAYGEIPNSYFDFVAFGYYGTYPIYAYVKDEFDRVSTVATTDVTYAPDTTPPVLQSMIPVIGGVDVPITTDFTMNFNEGINTYNMDGTPNCPLHIPCTMSFNSVVNQLTVKPLFPLEYSKSYGGAWWVSDYAGNSTPLTIAFTTVKKPDNVSIPTLTLDLSANGVITGNPVYASGVINVTNNSVANQNISLVITKPDGSLHFESVTTDQDGLYSDIPLTSYLGQLGTYKIQAFGGSGTGSTAPNKSEIKQLRVLPVAGYAIVLQGRIPSGEGAEAHAKTATRVKNALLARGLTSENIISITSNDFSSGKAELQAALYAVAARANITPAPLNLILIDHGDPAEFHLGAEVITPAELAGWLDTMENMLVASAALQPRMVVVGSCYSGTFIPALAKVGRTIITSASNTEQSFRGPSEPDGIRSGEFFLDELYRGLRRGESLRDAFNKGAAAVRVQSRRGGVVSSSDDKALQNPLISYRGDTTGVTEIPTGVADDAPDVAYLGSGDNFAYDPQGMIPHDRTAAVTTLFLDENSSSKEVSLKVDQSQSGWNAWFEIRKPSLPLALDGGSSQLIAELPRVQMLYDAATGSFTGTYAEFTDAGSYDITIYLQDPSTGEISPKRIALYRERANNSTPQAPVLAAPTGALTTASAFMAEWSESIDPDGDTVTYTMLVSKQADMGNPVLVKEGLNIPANVITYDDGLRDLTTYYWQVWAVDSYGAVTKSGVESFRTDNTNGLPSYITGVVRNKTTGSKLPAVSLDTAKASYKSYSNGAFLIAAAPGSILLTASADGYTAKPVSLIVSPGKVTTQNIELSPLAPETVNITSVVSSAAASGYLDCPAVVTKGAEVSCSMQAGTGYQFSAIEGCGGELSGNRYNLTATTDCSVTASFIPVIPSGTTVYSVTGSSTVGGSLVCIPATVTSGASSTCVLNTLPGFKLTALTDNAAALELPTGKNFTISNITANHAVSATFINDRPGDCNGSGTVDIAEVQSAINMFLGLKSVQACVDTDGINGVSIAEVQKTINSFLGL
ncbi:MAG: choice-of-anchor D domain-containing protein [Desulfuromonadaceae bacterium]|nr:choice-of-anchor D domain-containing protein [Desulfuromonadaceae bacterium]